MMALRFTFFTLKRMELSELFVPLQWTFRQTDEQQPFQPLPLPFLRPFGSKRLLRRRADGRGAAKPSGADAKLEINNNRTTKI
jgi:hypothetical protein